MRPLMTLSLAAALAGSAAAAQITPELESRIRLEQETEILVYFHDVEPAQAGKAVSQEAAIRRLQANLARSLSVIDNEMGFAAEGRITQKNWISNSISMKADAAVVHEIARHPAVRRVLFDAPVYPAETVEATTQRPESDAYTYGLKVLGVDKVREMYGITGAGVRLGNIDTGADGNHPDLAGKIVAYLDPSGETTEPTDTHGHGTHTAATMVGQAASGTSIGVAPDADLLVARGIAGSSTLSNLLASMEWMIDPDGDPATADAPVVVSMSWHSGGGDQEPFYEAIAAMEAAGVIPNFSAGNSGTSGLTHPKEFPGTFTTAATDSNDGIASFSSRGPANYKGVEQLKPEWGAPGVDVYSAKPGGGYTKMSGTSMAAPHGAGVIGLLFAANPTLTQAQVKEILISTAVDLGAEGWDPAFGNGRLNAFAAVSLVATGGKINGKVVDAGGAAISYATVTVVERAFTMNVKDDGSFKLMLPEGDYTLEFKAFGYVAATSQVSVEKDGEYALELALDQAESHAVTGTLAAAEGGAGVAGRISILGTPLPAVEVGADGAFDVTLPAGTYTFSVMAFGYQVASSEVTVPLAAGDSVDFSLAPLPPILVIDDDAGKSYESFYQAALSDLGQEFGVLDAAAAMDENTLLPYETVIWLTGDASSNLLSGDDKARLDAYLANGGKLIISGQDLGYGMKSDSFYTGTLKAKYLKDTAGVHNVSGFGMDFTIKGGDGANNQKYPDVVEANDGGVAVFEYSEGKGVAGIKSGNAIYLAFGFEAVSTAADRAQLMGRLLGGDAKEDTASQATRNVARKAAFEQLER